MTEVMVHSAVGENFSYLQSKFKKNQTESKPQMLIEDSDNNELDESTERFTDKIDTDCDKISEESSSESNAMDSAVMAGIQGSSNRTVKGNIFREGFKYVSTETTVINATYNVISQSTVHGVKEIPPVGKHEIPASVMTDNTDKSRVIVQILTSDAKKSMKSHNVIENKSINVENQSAHSFRDDVFNILSKPRYPSTHLVKDVKTSKALGVFETFERKKTSPTKTLTKKDRIRRKRSLKSFFLHEKGPNIGEIEQASSCLKEATPNALRLVHYVLYDKYGLCSTDSQISQTQKNILRFCGYPFDEKSSEFMKRANCLKKIPLPMLNEVHQAIFGKTSLTSRRLMVEQLMDFFLKPKSYNKILRRMTHNTQFLLGEDYNYLKEKAMKGPLPSVSLKRLGMSEIERIKNDIKLKPGKHELQRVKSNILKEETDSNSSSYSLPPYVLNGPGTKLKHITAIKRNIISAGEKDINLLHFILYGQMGSGNVETSRKNILEFSGFLKCQTEFIAERKSILIRMDQTSLFGLCKILCLKAKTSPRIYRIKKILEYLRAPYNPFKITRYKRKEKCVYNSSLSKGVTSKPSDKSYAQTSVLEESEEEVVGDSGCRLRDLNKICSNIECSAPSDLTELNDLLFAKPCDETEIHEKILNFTRFGFTDNSVHYHYRRTLMFYMGPCILRKIAKLLDLEDTDNERSHEDLTSSILRFLMQKKRPDSLHARSSVSSFKSATEKTESQEKNAQCERFQPHTISAIHKKSVVIHRLSKSSVQTNLHSSSDDVLVPRLPTSSVHSNMNNSSVKVSVPKPCTEANVCNPSHNTLVPSGIKEMNDICSTQVNTAEDDSIPLRVFIHHPTDQELKEVIDHIIQDNLWNITLGELVQKVYNKYPDYHLAYRESFIKAEARQMLSKLRSNAYDVVQKMSLNQITM